MPKIVKSSLNKLEIRLNRPERSWGLVYEDTEESAGELNRITVTRIPLTATTATSTRTTL